MIELRKGSQVERAVLANNSVVRPSATAPEPSKAWAIDSLGIDSLGIEFGGSRIVSDIDDCVLFTKTAIIKNGVSPQEFHFNKETFDNCQEQVTKDAELTPWGRDIKKALHLGFEVILLTSARAGRAEAIAEKLGVRRDYLFQIVEGCADDHKIEHLNLVTSPTLYVDDKVNVLKAVKNDNVVLAHYNPYPKFIRRR